MSVCLSFFCFIVLLFLWALLPEIKPMMMMMIVAMGLVGSQFFLVCGGSGWVGSVKGDP